jgi:exportin-T
MMSVWGGPDKLGGASNNSNPTSPVNTQSSLPGFDEFAVTRFSALSWSIPATNGFSAKDAQARQVLQEVAGLQAEILKKVGTPYGDRLREELRGMGVDDSSIDEYLRHLVGALENQKKDKEWRQFFVRFIERASG